jgi:flavin reductase (DIM6/NTAB) family NADH-FMN oxidoreductase RutF
VSHAAGTGRSAGVVGHVPPGSDPEEYDRLRRRVLWRLPSGIYVLGSRRGDQRHLMTCNLAMQLCVTPKILGVSVERAALTHELVTASGCFALSLVAREDRALVRRFVKPAPHDLASSTVGGVAYADAPVTGAPVLASAPAFLDCRVVEQFDLGSHTLFAGEVMAAGFGDGGEEVELLRMEDTRMNYGG